MTVFYTQDSKGDFDAAAVEHVTNNELLEEAVLQRPTENLRARTEVLREHVNHSDLRMMRNEGLFIYGDDLVFDGAWDGAGSPPAAGAAGSGRLRSVTSGTGVLGIYPAVNSTLGAFANYNSGAGALVLTSKKYVYQGAHEIQLQIENVVSGGGVTVTMEGGAAVSQGFAAEMPREQRRIRVGIEEGVHDFDAVKTAIDGDPDASLLVNVTTNTGSSFVSSLDTTNLSNGLDILYWYTDDTELETFYDASNDNVLQSGDTLAVKFGTAFERDSYVATRGDIANPSKVLAASLVNIKNDTSTPEFYLPIFTATSTTYGYLANGDKFVNGKAASPGGGTAVQQDFTVHAANVANPHQVTASQVDSEGGSERLVAQINAGSVLIDADRVDVATVSNFGVVKVSKTPAGDATALEVGEKGAVSGVASLDTGGIVELAQLPAAAQTYVLGERVRADANGWGDLMTPPGTLVVFPNNLSGTAQGFSDVGVIDPDVYKRIRVYMHFNTTLSVDADLDFDIYFDNMPWAATPTTAGSSQNRIVAVGDEFVTVEFDDGTDATLFTAGKLVHFEIRPTKNAGTGNLYIQYSRVEYTLK